jgi:hypothetical protein
VVNLRATAKRLDKSWWRNSVSNEGIEFDMTISRKPWRWA